MSEITTPSLFNIQSSANTAPDFQMVMKNALEQQLGIANTQIGLNPGVAEIKSPSTDIRSTRSSFYDTISNPRTSSDSNTLKKTISGLLSLDRAAEAELANNEKYLMRGAEALKALTGKQSEASLNYSVPQRSVAEIKPEGTQNSYSSTLDNSKDIIDYISMMSDNSKKMQASMLESNPASAYKQAVESAAASNMFMIGFQIKQSLNNMRLTNLYTDRSVMYTMVESAMKSVSNAWKTLSSSQ